MTEKDRRDGSNGEKKEHMSFVDRIQNFAKKDKDSVKSGRGKITMVDEEGGSIELYVVEETKLNGMYYLLVTEAPEDEDGECYIMRDCSNDGDEEASYMMVDNETEAEHVFTVFEKLMENQDIELER